jgi:hypothetical protein
MLLHQLRMRLLMPCEQRLIRLKPFDGALQPVLTILPDCYKLFAAVTEPCPSTETPTDGRM